MDVARYLFILIFVAVIGPRTGGGAALAQSGHFSAVSLSMGATGTAYLDSYHANFMNPANLMLKNENQPSVSFGVPGGISAAAGGPLLNISAYNKHFTKGQKVNPDAALSDWFGKAAGNSRRMGLTMDIIPVAGAWSGEHMSFSLAFRNRTRYSYSMNRGYAEVLLTGISEERFGNPKPVNFSSEITLSSEISAGFAYKILELPALPGIGENIKVYAGVAPKYIVPHHTSRIDFNSTLQVTADQVTHNFNYTFETVGALNSQFEAYHQALQADNFNGSIGDFIDPSAGDFRISQGSGFGLDLGGTVTMDLAGPVAGLFSWIDGPKTLRAGISVTDLGSISYHKNAGSYTANGRFNWDGVDLSEGFSESLTDSLSNDIYLNVKSGNTKRIVRKLPAKVQLGGYIQAGNLSLALDLVKGLNRIGMNSPRLSMGLGAEYKFFSILPLRAGYQTGGLTSSRITFGTGLDLRNFEFSVGALTVPESMRRGSAVAGAWSGLRFRF